MNKRQRENLTRLLKPRHIAFVGGRANLPAIEICREAGFEGDIWPVHPTYDELGGEKVYASVTDLPEGPDACFIGIGRDASIDIVRALNDRDSGGVVCHAAGFGELGAAGTALQEELVEASGDLALVGPNSNGLINHLDGLTLWPVKSHTPKRLDKGIAIVSQSGGVAFNYVDNIRGVSAAYIVSTGNQAALDLGDYVDVLAGDPRVTAIGVFLEGLRDVAGFSAAARKAQLRGLPIVALKVGVTEIGARMALTHTGSMASGQAFYDALFDRHGIVTVDSVPAFDETLKMLTVADPPAGNKVAVLTNSGAVRTMAADLAAKHGLELPDLTPATKAALREQIPDFATASNPLDYNAAYAGTEVFSMENKAALETCFTTMLRDDFDVAVMFGQFSGPVGEWGTYDSPTLEAWADTGKTFGKPTVAASQMPETFHPVSRDFCLDRGIVPLQGINDSMAAIARAVKAASNRDLDPEAPLPQPIAIAEGELWDEITSKDALRASGLPLLPYSDAAPDNAAAVADEIGFPVVLKVLSREIAHKSKIGGVRLNLTNQIEVDAAVSEITDSLAAHGHRTDRFLVEAMAPQTVAEIILGVSHDPRFGHALLVGVGGVAVERLGLSRLLLLPASDAAIARAVRDVADMLGLFDDATGSIIQAAHAVACFVADHRESLSELDINPLLVLADDSVVAVDAVIRMANDDV